MNASRFIKQAESLENVHIDTPNLTALLGGVGLGSSLIGIPVINKALPAKLNKYKTLLHVLNGTRGAVGGGLLLGSLLYNKD